MPNYTPLRATADFLSISPVHWQVWLFLVIIINIIFWCWGGKFMIMCGGFFVQIIKTACHLKTNQLFQRSEEWILILQTFSCLNIHVYTLRIENVKASGLNFSGKETFLCISSSFPMLMLEVLKYLKPRPSLRDMLNVRYGTIKMLFFIDKPYSFIPLAIHIPWRDSVLHQGETFI